MDEQDYANSFKPDNAISPPPTGKGGPAAPSGGFSEQDFANSFNPDIPAGVIDEQAKALEAAKPKKPQKQLQPTTAEDVAKSLGSGVEVGAAQLAGVPGDIASAARWLKEEGGYYGRKALEHYGYLPEGTADQYQQQVDTDRQDPNRNWVGYLPTSSVTEEAARKYLPGANYEPQSVGGEYGHTIGEVVPALLGGEGSLVKKLGTAAIAGGASEAAGQATEGTPYEGVARLGGMLAAPLAAEKTLSRPLGAIGSAFGVGDEALGAVGLKSGSMVARDKVVADAARLKQLGLFNGLPEENINAVRNQEIADGVKPADSIISSAAALTDSPTDIVKTFIKNSSLANPKVQAGVQELYGNVGRASEVADMTATRILNDMQDEATVNALNSQRAYHGLPTDIVNAPEANQVKKIADEVRQGAYDRIFQPVFDEHQSVNSSTLQSILPFIDNNVVDNTITDFNKIRGVDNLKGLNVQQQYPFGLVKNQSGKYEMIGATNPLSGDMQGPVKGAPLQFWDLLKNNLYRTQNVADRATAGMIDEGLDQYFANRNLPNQLKIAQKNFGDIRNQGNMIDAGMRFITDGAYQTNAAKRATFLNRWDKLSDVEKGLYQSGVLQQIQSTLSQGQQGYKNWNKILQNKDNRQLLQEIIDFRPQGAPPSTGASNFEKFSTALDVAQAFKKEHVNNVLVNTPEARTFLGKILGMGDRSLFDVMLHTAYRGAFSPELGAITAIGGGIGYIRQVYRDRQALKMLEMFNNKDPVQAMQLARDIANHKEAKTSWQKVRSLLDFSNKATINFYRRAAMANAASQPQGQKNGGAVTDRPTRATGGRIPEVDKMFKEAKKSLDNQTKPMLSVHDDAIVHALRIAQGRV